MNKVRLLKFSAAIIVVMLNAFFIESVTDSIAIIAIENAILGILLGFIIIKLKI